MNIKPFIRWLSEENGNIIVLSELNELDIIDWKDYLQQLNQHESTINLKLASLKSYFSFLNIKGYIHFNPLLNIKRIKAVNTDSAKSFSSSEYKKIRRYILKSGNVQHWTMWNVLTGCGIRSNELANLKCTNVNISKRKGTLRVRGKGNKIWYIPLNNQTRISILNWLEQRTILEKESQYLFISQRNIQYTRSGI